ncbi:MAG: F0F1 ATP synthase subunit alpha [Bacillota bacterium]
MSINLDNIKGEIEYRVSKLQVESTDQSTGKIIFSGDGVIKVDGLEKVKYDELIETEEGISAIALNLETDSVGAVLLEDEDKAYAGQTVKSTGKIVEVPVGDELLGRVVNPLGKPLDGKGDIKSHKYRPIETPAPSIPDRGKVNQPLSTGILSIDSMIPIGRGQRELIIGDKQTGKTAIAIDAIINQKDTGVLCVYVAIGQKASTITNIVNMLERHDCMKHTVIVCSRAMDSSALQYIAPYSGCAIAEEFMWQGKDVLIVYDDLSKHAIAYRTIALLLKRPPGREAYPGDIFYLHSRLLERAAKLSDENGGGSITALPIVETLAGDISSYIPTNVISITDGQIFLESELFNSGLRPAVNVGLSVSRVGGAAQTKAVKKVVGKLRLDLAQYRELLAFKQFGSDLDKVTKKVLDHGDVVTASLKQKQYSPYSHEEMVVMLHVLNNSLADEIPTSKICDFLNKLTKYFEAHNKNEFDLLKETQEVSEEITTAIEKATAEYKELYEKA